MKPLFNFNRREFIRNTGTAAAGLALSKSFAIASDNPQRKIRIGLIGCGGRGFFICDRMLEHGSFEIVAGADYFEDRLAEFSQNYSVEKSRLYPGLNGFRKLLESKDVDAVAIMSPPYFHPEQAEAAVMAGKHVYLAKPVAVDVPGSLSIKQSGALATEKGLCYLVDFQTRANEAFKQAVRLVHGGSIGAYSFGESYYHAGNPFENRPSTDMLRQDPDNPENRLRAWGLDRVLSGDIITEQNIHTLDVSSWILNEDPISAMGTCNGKTRDAGDCNDHFSVVFKFSNSVDVVFHSRQYSANGTKPDGIYNRMFGTNGALETKYSGDVILRGKPVYKGSSANLYKTGAEENVRAFYDQILAGDASNLTVVPSVNSTLLTILGREAAYSGKVVSWTSMMDAKKRLTIDLDLRA